MKNGTNGLRTKLVGLALTMMLGLAQAQNAAAPALDLTQAQNGVAAAAADAQKNLAPVVEETKAAVETAVAAGQAAATEVVAEVKEVAAEVTAAAAPAATTTEAADTAAPAAETPAADTTSKTAEDAIDLSQLPGIWYIAPIMALLALAMAYKFFLEVKNSNPGDSEMQRIAGYVTEGAMAYLKRQYKVVAVFFVLVSIALFIMGQLHLQHQIVFIAFLSGGLFSGLCGWFGMKTATLASNRTAQGAKESLDRGLKVAFRAGSVMGLVVVGFGLLDICMWLFLLPKIYPQISLVEVTVVMLTFGMGASAQALFARVGGGIFTKAADVGADLVGKVEAGIPEDDPRNPATIADNVGDNVGDVAGMGADLYESYCGSILATAALGVSAAVALGLSQADALRLLAAPMVLAGAGIFMSIIGIYMVSTKEGASMKQLMSALMRGLWGSSLLILVAAYFICTYVLDIPGIQSMGIFYAICAGMIAGLIIGKATEYFTSYDFKPTQHVAKNATTGHATVIISGIAEGMQSTWVAITTVIVTILISFGLSGGNDNILMGLYGIGIAAVSMLSTLGYSLATDAYGPIADNAGGNAEMTHQDPSVRKKTDSLDSLGNTTAAIGKGFAIGSAALTALALLAAYVEEVRVGLVREGRAALVQEYKGESPVHTMFSIGYGKIAFKDVAGSAENCYDSILVLEGDKKALKPGKIEHSNLEMSEGISGHLTFAYDGKEYRGVLASRASLEDYMAYYNVTLMNPKVLCGAFAGVMLVFVFTAMSMKAVGRAAMAMVTEVRRQFREIPGILEGKAIPEYAKCVAISTAGAQKEMIIPSMLCIVVPIVVGLVLDVSGVLGLLLGGLSSGFALAVFMANAGGTWDNAKKFIETGQYGGKGSDAHKAAVTGDTVGDPFKDTSGPCLNIVIKLMSMVSVVFAGLIVKYAPIVSEWLNLG